MINFLTISWILAPIIFLIILSVGLKTNILRENQGESKISFSKFQVWLWTLIICPILVLHWGYSDNYIFTVNETCLFLIGIPVETLIM